MAKKNISTKKGNFSKKGDGNNKPKFQKPTPEVYKKTVYATDDMIRELIAIPGVIGEIAVGTDDIYSLEHSILRYFDEHIPDIEAGTNQFYHLNMSVDRCFLKTGKNVGLGWTINKKRDGKKYIIESISLTFTSYNPMRTVDEINYLVENGWEKENK